MIKRIEEVVFMIDNNEMKRLNEELAFKMEIDGKETVCYIVLNFTDEDTGNKYIVYTDGSKCEDGSLDLIASRYEVYHDDLIIKPIKEDWEYDLVDEMLNKVGEDDEFTS